MNTNLNTTVALNAAIDALNATLVALRVQLPQQSATVQQTQCNTLTIILQTLQALPAQTLLLAQAQPVQTQPLLQAQAQVLPRFVAGTPRLPPGVHAFRECGNLRLAPLLQCEANALGNTLPLQVLQLPRSINVDALCGLYVYHVYKANVATVFQLRKGGIEYLVAADNNLYTVVENALVRGMYRGVAQTWRIA